MGYPAGIGPEIVADVLAKPSIRKIASFLIIGDSLVFEKACKVISKKVPFDIVYNLKEVAFRKGRVFFLDLENVSKKNFRFGTISKIYGKASIEYLKEAVSIARSRVSDLLITAPIHKYAAELAGFKYSGHTEFLAKKTDARKYAMLLMGGPLKVALATTHIPIKDIACSISKEKILDKLILTDRYLKKYFGIKKPKIAVCGLNPHAGDKGLIGDEENRIITPAINLARRKRIDAIGPLAADGLFYNIYKGQYDATLCMYHDQGLVALKMVARDKAVNITLGLPFIRTSPGHGTALEIAGRKKASSESMEEAIKTAVKIYKRTNIVK